MFDHKEINIDNHTSRTYDGHDLIRSIGREKVLKLPYVLELIDDVRKLKRYRNWTDDEILDEVGRHMKIVFAAAP